MFNPHKSYSFYVLPICEYACSNLPLPAAVTPELPHYGIMKDICCILP